MKQLGTADRQINTSRRNIWALIAAVLLLLFVGELAESSLRSARNASAHQGSNLTDQTTNVVFVYLLKKGKSETSAHRWVHRSGIWRNTYLNMLVWSCFYPCILEAACWCVCVCIYVCVREALPVSHVNSMWRGCSKRKVESYIFATMAGVIKTLIHVFFLHGGR